MRRIIRENKNLIVCPRNRQYTDIIVCAANCDYRRLCKIYKEKISIEILMEFVEKHPDYKLVGELMPTEKIINKGEKKFWIVTGENQFVEVTESEVMKNPQKYIKKPIWQKPPFKYEVVVTLKRVKVED